MNNELSDVLTRIETDMATLRKLVANQPIKVPVLLHSYTPKQAERAKAAIEAAFRAGIVTYDKKRGMKMVVTKRTVLI